MVYDDRHRPASLADDPAWLRWSAAEPASWTETAPGTFEPGRDATSGLVRAALPSPRPEPRAVGGDPTGRRRRTRPGRP